MVGTDWWGVVLAAGEGRRFGGAKLAADFRGRPLVTWPVQTLMAANLSQVLVVLGHHASQVGPCLPSDSRLRVLENPEPGRGMGSSLAVAAGEALAGDASLLVVVLGDQPLLETATVRAVCAAAAASGAGAAAAGERGRAVHPVAFTRAHFAELAGLKGDQGGREILSRLGESLTLIPVAVGSSADVDRPEDLVRLDNTVYNRQRRV